MKKVQGKKKRVAAEKAAAAEQGEAEEGEAVETLASQAPEEDVTGDLLGTKDDDVIF